VGRRVDHGDPRWRELADHRERVSHAQALEAQVIAGLEIGDVESASLRIGHHVEQRGSHVRIARRRGQRGGVDREHVLIGRSKRTAEPQLRPAPSSQASPAARWTIKPVAGPGLPALSVVGGSAQPGVSVLPGHGSPIIVLVVWLPERNTAA
jgi:hypothetical protein